MRDWKTADREIAARQGFGLDKIAKMSAKRDFVAKVMLTSNELLENGRKLAIGGLDKLQGQWFKLPCAAGDRSFVFSQCGGVRFARSRRTAETKFRNGNEAIGMHLFKQNSAILVFEFPIGTLPSEQFTKVKGYSKLVGTMNKEHGGHRLHRKTRTKSYMFPC
jgi:hypothetical protein